QTVKVNDMSRVRRFGEAIGLEAEATENTSRTVAFPQLRTAMSQIAVPLAAGGTVIGVLFIESEERLAFGEDDEAVLEILAGQAASALRASEREAAAAEPRQAAPELAAAGREIRVSHHRFDDSIFVDGNYIRERRRRRAAAPDARMAPGRGPKRVHKPGNATRGRSPDAGDKGQSRNPAIAPAPQARGEAGPDQDRSNRQRSRSPRDGRTAHARGAGMSGFEPPMTRLQPVRIALTDLAHSLCPDDYPTLSWNMLDH
ncbi:GAF domain-containing protein, partial [Mesorhizobium sp.]|uniref:GAF domain-containing protein n=1 Tax=Mesorhizobium sp. TaxID=1871066 RepID=UPI0025D4328D